MTEPVCDLIVLSWNHLEETRPCLDSLFATVDVPSRLLIVDNGSEPAVRSYLAGVRAQGAIQDVVLIQNATNEGFPRGMNHGLRAASAPFACLLNNDLRFTAGWLREMLDVAQTEPAIGLVNPASNTFGHRPPPGTSSDAYLDAIRRRRGEHSEVGMCIGFCLLIKRAVIERVGLLSESVDRVFFEDEDYSMRALRAGFRCVVAEGAYVYHAEHQSVQELPEREALFRRNQRWCNEQWGRWVRIAWPQFEPPAPGSDELRRWLGELLRWARRRTHVYVYAPVPTGYTVPTLFTSVGLRPHSDIHWRVVPRALAPLATVTAIISRQKKPFDLIVVPQPGWSGLVGGLRWLHRADVVNAADEEQLTQAWTRRSRLPL
ncbi:MAG: hypothetical protein COV75_08295 [Candidatus Omnitrophica bacterium CG11_big_fil_rev_8_21_14_0_20_63_9]|nr:MAG: hypothetical protein COV75_08295 [Candidatus Omnitrophica bacterium CG11_big_fil_rev_8_21_14_0_20_63_9]